MNRDDFATQLDLPIPELQEDLDHWKTKISIHIGSHMPDVLAAVLPALNKFPTDPDIVLSAVIAALLDRKPDVALRYLQRFTKRWSAMGLEDQLLHAVALAQQGQWRQAARILNQHDPWELARSINFLPNHEHVRRWFLGIIDGIETEARAQRINAVARKFALKKFTPPRAASPQAKNQAAAAKTPAGTSPPVKPIEAKPTGPPPLPVHDANIPLTLNYAASLDARLARTASLSHGFSHGFTRYAAVDSPEAFQLRYELVQLGLLQGFDELLCLPTLRAVETYWYQIEAARKVLKQFRGRVLLADEVGLGKTVEAGMVLKEYLMRGMAERVLILTPATLVGQWQEEMATKFDLAFLTTYDSHVRTDPATFWEQPRVIASIATARRAEHQPRLAEQHYDIVIVDEAHHLKNRASANWRLVNSLTKRFLLLLSATPVQNNLIELYNLLTLLKPGIFKTEKEFRASYMMSGKPRVPANRERMHDLMRDVMIRNTRSLVDVRLPLRHATTLRLEPSEEEAACYTQLTELAQAEYQKGSARQRLALRHLLSAAGSHATTAAGAIGRFNKGESAGQEWRQLQRRYAAIKQTTKERALLELIEGNPNEKKLIFVHHRETLERLAWLMDEKGWSFALFEGGMTGPEKDRAILQFSEDIPLLLCTESGGEGRNMQFCNTLINFDLPWNPMTIAQRIGRIHRIGQTRDVFIFNLALRGTLEEQVLRILDEKINMFELVVGDVDAILGEMEDEVDFAELVFSAWVGTTETDRNAAFEALGERLVEARSQYESIKSLDEELFGEEFVAV